MMEIQKIGVIGLGIMGKPMARNLLRAGYRLVLHNRSRAAVDELVGEGALSAQSPRGVAELSNVVITMLADPPTVEQVIAGANGILEGVRHGMTIIDMSTTSVSLTRKLAHMVESRGCDMLDAPVSGGDVGARDGTLTIMVGGKRAAFQRALPILRNLGSRVTYIGEAGAGQIAKAANQIIVGITIQAVAEALVLAEKSGVDPTQVREALLGGFASSRVLEVHGKRMLQRDFVPGGRVKAHYKDMQIVTELASEMNLDLPFSRQVEAKFAELIRRGLGDQDHAALLNLLE